jgi:hypothetical protein
MQPLFSAFSNISQTKFHDWIDLCLIFCNISYTELNNWINIYFYLFETFHKQFNDWIDFYFSFFLEHFCRAFLFAFLYSSSVMNSLKRTLSNIKLSSRMFRCNFGFGEFSGKTKLNNLMTRLTFRFEVLKVNFWCKKVNRKNNFECVVLKKKFKFENYFLSASPFFNPF